MDTKIKLISKIRDAELPEVESKLLEMAFLQLSAAEQKDLLFLLNEDSMLIYVLNDLCKRKREVIISGDDISWTKFLRYEYRVLSGYE